MPFDPQTKETYVENLFSSIAPKYDLLNSVLSLNLHKSWRRFAVRQCGLSPGDRALDVGAGTMDFAIELSKAVGPEGRVVGVDFCGPMLQIGAGKLARREIGNVLVAQANAERLPFSDDAFRASTTGFVLRNVASVENALAEMARVTAPGGRVISLELAKPRGPVFRRIYDMYFYYLLPAIGGVVNGEREPYQYLPNSLKSFHSREELALIMEKVGLTDVKVFDLTGGIVAVHAGTKI